MTSLAWTISLAIALSLPLAERELGLFRVSAYCPCSICCGPNAKGITASGKRAAVGMCAADPSIPFGTRLHVDGLGVVTVEDRGGKIRGKRLDIYCETHAAALRWGVRYLRIKVTK